MSNPILPTEGMLRIWHIPNPPRPPFNKVVRDVEHAKEVLTVIADYDNYLGDDYIFANACGLEIYTGGEWNEWYNEVDEDIAHIMRMEA